jgi:hypothetical protein
MGRKIPSFRIALELEERDWKHNQKTEITGHLHVSYYYGKNC